MSSVAGAVYVGTARFSNITTMAIKIDGQVNPGEAVIGSNSVSDVIAGGSRSAGRSRSSMTAKRWPTCS